VSFPFDYTVRQGKIIRVFNSQYAKRAGRVLVALAAAALPASAGWSPPETISPPAGEWHTCYNFARALVADDAGNLHAVFFEGEGGRTYYRRYDRGAGRWGALQQLDEAGGRDVAIIVDGRGGLHVFFKAGAAICHRAGDTAGHWGRPAYLNVEGWRFGYPSPLALPSGDVALAMVGEPRIGRPTYIWFTVWRRENQSFDPPIRLSESTGENGSWMPSLADFRDKLHLVWRDDSTGEFEVYERIREGSNWKPTRRLTYDPAPSFHPRLIVDGDDVLRLQFMDRRNGNPAIWEMVDRGAGWSPEYVLYDGGAGAYHPNPILAPTGQLLTFWEDNRETPEHEIYFGSLFGGVWTEAGRVSRTPEAESTLASPAVTSREVAVAYSQSPGKVYVQRLPLSEVPVAGVTFVARPAPGGAKLWWDGDAVGRFVNFDLYRRSPSEPGWRRINLGPIAGRRPFRFDDETPIPGDYAYKLEGRTGTGYALTLGTARVAVGGARRFISGLNASPNPCRGALRVSWRQESSAAATVDAYDITGRRVTSVKVAGAAGANAAALETNRLAPGCYIVAVSAGGDALRTMFVVAR
jgi:hypothetical protein